MANRSAIDAKKARVRLLDEFSKLSLVLLELVGILNLAAYWCAVFAGLAPEPDVAVTGIVELVAPYVGYCALQLGLKASLNKNGLRIGKSGTVCEISKVDSSETPVGETMEQ